MRPPFCARSRSDFSLGIMERMGETFYQSIRFGCEAEAKSCGHPGSKMSNENDPEAEAICLDCLCESISSLCFNTNSGFSLPTKTTTDIINLLTPKENEDSVSCCLDFLDALFQHEDAIFIVFHGENAAPLCSAFRNVLVNNQPNLQKAVIRILSTILRTINSTGHDTSQHNKQLDSDTIPQLFIKVDLDHHACACLNTNDADLVNCSVEFFHLLCTKHDSGHERIAETLEKCLRTFTFKLHCDGLNKSAIYDFFTTCLSRLNEVNEVDYNLQQLIIALCDNMILKKNWSAEDRLMYLRLLFYCKDARAQESLSRILNSVRLSETPKTNLECLQQFLAICRECAVGVGWCMTYFIMKYAVTDTEYLKFLIVLLQCNFKSDHVQMTGVVQDTNVSKVFLNQLNNMTFNLVNALYQVIDDDKERYVWIALTEISKYLFRRIVDLGDAEVLTCFKDFMYSAPVLIMIETFLYLEKDPMRVDIAVIEFFNVWVKHLLFISSKVPPVRLNVDQSIGPSRPFRLQILLVRIKDWLGNGSEDSSENVEESVRLSDFTSITCNVDRILSNNTTPTTS